MECKDKS